MTGKWAAGDLAVVGEGDDLGGRHVRVAAEQDPINALPVLLGALKSLKLSNSAFFRSSARCQVSLSNPPSRRMS